MWLMMQQDEPEDYVIATGETHSPREFAERACAIAGFDLVWEGEGEDEVGKDGKTGNTLIAIDSKYYRPTEVDLLLGDPSKARQNLGWVPRVTFEELVEIMMRADMELWGVG